MQQCGVDSEKQREILLNFSSGEELLTATKALSCSLADVMVQRERLLFGREEEEIRDRLRRRWEIMRQSATLGLQELHRTQGGLIGGEARILEERYRQGRTLLAGLSGRALIYAMGVMEVNAGLGRIVAAPTAGSAGVLPGVLLAMVETERYGEEAVLDALLVASALGLLITARASVSGAEAGCQAEVGSASAMAAAALVALEGGTAEEMLGAATHALSNLLGLVCDPVRGLVELPCQRRNALGALNAFAAADLSLAGIAGPVPFDEMVAALYAVGRALPPSLRETAQGGLAACPSWQAAGASGTGGGCTACCACV